jgi:uncharacterized RDD family membrane protein YckC
LITPSFLKRVLSGFYDLLLLAGVLMLAGFVMVPVGRGLALDVHQGQVFTRIWALTVVSSYYLWFWTHGGQTLPMKTWRLRLCNQDGSALKLDRALLRLVLVAAGWGLGGAHLFWALFDRDKQFLHDRILGTRLVSISP